MAVQPFLYLAITDGTTTVTLSDGANGSTNYPPQANSWAPNVAALNQSMLAGRGPYTDVVEEITINIRDTTAALCYGRLDTLARLLDQADRWWMRNEGVSPVMFKYAPQGSTIASTAAPFVAFILGRVAGDTTSAAELPPNFDSAGNQFVMIGVKIKVLRRGLWAGANDNTGASGAAANCTVLTQTFSPTWPTSSPLTVEIGGFNKTATPILRAGFLCVGSASGDIQVVEAETGTVAGYTNVADAANLARGGAVLRYTPTGTTAVTSGAISGMTGVGGCPVAIIAAVRNNSATTTFLLQANLSGAAGAISTAGTGIDASTTQPRLVNLGQVVGNALTGLTVTVTASAASGSLDIDYLIIVMIRNETCGIVAHDELSLANLSTSGAATLDLAFNPTSDRVPLAYVGGTGGTAPIPYRGVLPLQTTGTSVQALWAACNGQYWRFTNTSNAIVNVTLNVSRWRSVLTPQ